jgi:hypothetical protein
VSIGDLYAAELIAPPCIDMSTSIVRIYTPEGFVIAADGRNYDLETKRKVSDSVQKIFPIEQPGRRLAYAISGTAELTPQGSTEIVFDVLAAIHASVETLAEETPRSLWHYAQALSERLVELPEHAQRVLSGNEAPTIIFFDGYYDGRPKRAHVALFYDGQVPEVSIDELHPGHPIGVGSNEIIQVLADKDGTLAKYRAPAMDVRPENRTLSDAIDVARSWTAAHCGPEAESISPLCVAIGGEVRMCTLTFRAGVQWIPYIPIN